MDKRRVNVGDTVLMILPYSEVCMHLKIAGQARQVQLLHGAAQIYSEDGTPFSFPVGCGEAGFHYDDLGWYYVN